MNNIFPPFRPQFNTPYFYRKRFYSPQNIQISQNKTLESANTHQDSITVQNPTINKETLASTRQFETAKPLLEFHGIKLFNDDLLILLLIYFLYKENINDKLLLIALFSLLF